MQVQLTFLVASDPDGAAEVWAALDHEQRRRVLEVLARLIVKAADVRADAASTRGDDDE